MDYQGDSNNELDESKQIAAPEMQNDFEEETAAEIADVNVENINDEDEDIDVFHIYGWVSIALSVVSFFFVPILFAGAGIIVGFIARNKEAPILGNIAIAVGIISILARLFLLPLI